MKCLSDKYIKSSNNTPVNSKLKRKKNEINKSK